MHSINELITQPEGMFEKPSIHITMRHLPQNFSFSFAPPALWVCWVRIKWISGDQILAQHVSRCLSQNYMAMAVVENRRGEAGG